MALIDQYGTDCLAWTPATIRMQVEEDFGVKLPKVNFDKLMAGITVLTTNYFYKNLPRFIELCNALAGDDFDPESFDPADSYECAWGITEALLLCPPDEEEPFCDDIRYYIGAVLRDEGYVTPPDILKIGLDADFSQQVTHSWSDDPEMFAGIYQKNQDKAAELSDVIRENLMDMMQQIQMLPLKNGDATQLVDKLRRNIRM